MKNLILMLSFLISFTANASEMTEARLFGYYKNSTSCAIAYNLQYKIAAVTNTIDMGVNSVRTLERIGPLTTAWVTISMRLENELQTKFKWSNKRVGDYRSNLFTTTAQALGMNLWHMNIASEFVEHLFSSTDGCNDLAVEIQKVFKDTLDKSIIAPKPKIPDASQDSNKPKKRM